MPVTSNYAFVNIALHALCQLPFAAASSDLIFSWFVVANFRGGSKQGVQTGVGEAN